MLKFPTQFFKLFWTYFKLKNLKHLHSNCNWAHPKSCVKSYLRMQHNSLTTPCNKDMKNMKIKVLKFTYVMKYVKSCVENHVKNCEVCWKPFQKHCDVTMMWPFQYILYKTKRVKLKTRTEGNRFIGCYMCSLVKILCVLKDKTELVCW